MANQFFNSSEETDDCEDISRYIYFLYDYNDNLLYIGKTVNLIQRLKCHFNKLGLKLQPWKQDVDKDKIVIYRCNNDTDLDMYETYFINKYKPKYNLEKVFLCTSSFDLPYLEPIILKKQYEEAQTVIDCFNANLDNDMFTETLFKGVDPNYLCRSGNKLKLTTF